MAGVCWKEENGQLHIVYRNHALQISRGTEEVYTAQLH